MEKGLGTSLKTAKKQRIILAVLAAVTLLITLFIWSNSLKDSKRSTSASDTVIDLIQPVLDSICKDAKQQSFFVRKLAHVSEFAALGIAVAFLHRKYTQYTLHKSFYGFADFYGLAAAVTDEFIQSFSDRSDSVRDVLIDFSGYMIGALLVTCIFLIIDKKRDDRQKWKPNGNT